MLHLVLLNFLELKMSNYAEECLKKYVKIRETSKVQIKFEIYPNQILIYYYYYDEEYFDLLRTIRNLYKYLRKCNMHLNWKTYADVKIYNVTALNTTKRMTRLDIKKR